MADFKNEINRRYRNNADAGQRPFTSDEVEWLRRNFNPIDDLGIILKDNNTPPVTNGVPRIFIMGYDAQNKDRIQTLSDLNIEMNSAEFWKQVQLGNVFAYPAGEKNPVQLQAKPMEKGAHPQFSYSKSVTADTLPSFEKVKKPNFLKRWFSFLSKRWRDEIQQYDNKLNDQTYNFQDLNDYARKRVCKDAELEKTRVAEHLAYLEKHRIAEEKLKDYNNAQDFKEQLEKREGHVDKMYQPIPVQEKLMTKGGENNYGYYTQDEFNQLTKFDIKMDQIKAGPGKVPFSDRDFATMAYFNSTTHENLKATRHLRGAIDKNYVTSTVKAGFHKTVEEAQEAYDTAVSNFPTTDLFVSAERPRDSDGVIIQDTINPSRQQTKDAFIAYKNGDSSKLAKMVAHAVNYAADDMAAINLSGSEARGTILMGSRLNEILEKDPNLITEAQKHGMKDENLKAVQGMAKFHKIQEAGTEAKIKLAEAKAYNRDLREEDKQKYLKDIVKAEIAEKTFMDGQDKLSLDGAQWYAENQLQYQQLPPQELLAKYKADPMSRPDPEDGKVYHDTLSLLYSQKMRQNPRSPFMQELGTEQGLNKLDRTAEEIIKQEKLYTKGQSATDLHEKMKTHQYDPNVLQNVGQTIKNEFNGVKKVVQPHVQQPEIQKSTGFSLGHQG